MSPELFGPEDVAPALGNAHADEPRMYGQHIHNLE